MNRLAKELSRRGLVHESDELEIFRTGIEACTSFVGIFNDIIVLYHSSNVLDPMYILYDRNFNFIAQQDVCRTNLPSFDGKHVNPWFVCCNLPDGQ